METVYQIKFESNDWESNVVYVCVFVFVSMDMDKFTSFSFKWIDNNENRKAVPGACFVVTDA